ncbi:hypothetical protein CRG98_004184 [Punica granatum]|uniref:Uncharacterized protein n=1 Tax=Punica granatum TaxID=22663 RepID=A0A2I0L4A5_PUNGR|nr:hypothetical protein CRG98_004184 [Punica granatum]
MGTEVQFKSHMPGYYSMRDLNEDANSYNNWPLHYRDGPLPNGQFYNYSRPSATADTYVDYDKDAVKQKMLEHEAIFKKQVYELHRLYRIQKDLMDEIRRKELASSPLASSSFLPEDAQKWQSPGFLSNCRRPSISGSEASYSPMKSLTGNNSPQASPFPPQNGCTSKVPEWLESRPSKVRRRMIDLTLPADNYIDPEESEPFKNDPYDPARRAVTDLNQPIQIEDTNMPAHPRSRALFDGKILGKELSCKSQCGSSNGTSSNRHTESNGGGSGWVSYAINAGHDNGVPEHAPQSRIHEVPMHLPAHTVNQHKVSLSTDWAKSHSHLLSPWQRPSASLTQKAVSVEVGPSLDSYSIHHTNFEPPPLGHGVFSERWHQSNGRPESRLGNKSLYDRNGFYPMASSAGPKGISCRHNEQNSIDIKRSAAMDLSRVLSDGGQKQEDHVAVLPWLRADTSRKDEATAKSAFDFKEKNLYQPPTNQLTGRSELDECSRNTKILGIPIFGEPATPKKESSSLTGKSECEAAEGGKKRRMLDINLPCDQVPEELPVVENKEPSIKISGLKCEIDLNSCADEGETSLVIAHEASERKTLVVIDLEAPACPEMEEEISTEDEKHIQSIHRKIEHVPDETIKIAAEAIVAISSAVPDLPEPSSAENLQWFASIVLQERQVRNFSSSSEGIDYFESMTLKLSEMKDEEHLPQPLVPPEILKVGGEVSAVATSAVRPQRRGRQKRDFQRDILPGLTSLSRHEVMEDMQTFGGLMRATGHAWNCRPTRRGSARNRPARPRRKRKTTSCPSPPVPSPAYTSPVNLTGWGKTRRPRRQRCPAPAGNAPVIQLT